ncbi:MAG: (Fe-S)-binding protein [Desulfobacteraceae bacterium]|nr:(Fe-S)-binding protein [Desulfobacteraceae bacterium]
MFLLSNCTECGDCLSKCVYIEIDGEEAKKEFRNLIDGKPSPVISQCVSCMACDEICLEKANPFSLIVKRQEEQNEIDRFGKAKQMMEDAYTIPSKIEKRGEGGPVIGLCIYTGTPDLFEGVLFENATFFMGGEYFCGIGFYHIGAESPVKEKARAIVEGVTRVGAKDVVFYHDDCYTFFKVTAPEFGLEVPFRPISWPEFLYRRMKDLKGRIRPIHRKVAYQRPCASRYTPEKDHYVDEIFHLIGAEKPSRSYEGVTALCCGGAVVPRDWELADRIKHQNLHDASEAGAEIMVTLCPMCFASLKKRAAQHNLKILPLSQLCRVALEEVKI